MKKYLFIFTCALFTIGSVGCTSDSIESDDLETINEESKVNVEDSLLVFEFEAYFNSNDPRVNMLLGKWRAFKNGFGDLKSKNIRLEFLKSGYLVYEKGAGDNNYMLLSSNYGFMDDWEYDELDNAWTVTLRCTLSPKGPEVFQHEYYLCWVNNNYLVLFPGSRDDYKTIRFIVDPCTYYERTY